jgi:formylglycine-generating enzyme
MNGSDSESSNYLNLSTAILPVFESTDDLASFAKKLRVLRFQTITEAAAYVGIHHSNFVRYEAEGAAPPLGYLAWLACTLEAQVDLAEREASQIHLLREINKALLQHNPATTRFKNWQHLETMAGRWPSKGARKQPQPDTYGGDVEAESSGTDTSPADDGDFEAESSGTDTSPAIPFAPAYTAPSVEADIDDDGEQPHPQPLVSPKERWKRVQKKQQLIMIGGILGMMAVLFGGFYAYQFWSRAETPELPILAYEEAFIPSGPFIQGSTQQQIEYFGRLCAEAQAGLPYLCDATFFEDELPAREVTLSSYFIDRYEVTNDKFQQFVAAEGYITTAERAGQSLVLLQGTSVITEVEGADWRHPEGPEATIEGRGNHPVVHISYADALTYCTWARKRLPTEAEWEKAARGPESWLFPWGNQWEYDRGNYVVVTPDGRHYASGPSPVGSYTEGKSPYGVEDLLGNVSEWVADWYDPDYYKNHPLDRNPQGPETSPEGQHSKRGGGWATRAGFLHSAWRIDRPDETTNLLGFRCARDP